MDNHSLANVGLKSLCERKDLVICPTDKGRGIVVLDKADYHKEMCRILSDLNTYRELSSSPTSKYKKDLVNLVTKGFDQQILKKKEKAYLVPLAPRIPTI